MTKTQINEYNSNASIFNFALYKLIIALTIGTLTIGTLTIGALAIFGVSKLVAYTENKKLAAEQVALAELMKDDWLKERIEYFSKPSHSKEESFIFYCQMLGTKSQCEYYNDLSKKMNNVAP